MCEAWCSLGLVNSRPTALSWASPLARPIQSSSTRRDVVRETPPRRAAHRRSLRRSSAARTWHEIFANHRVRRARGPRWPGSYGRRLICPRKRTEKAWRPLPGTVAAKAKASRIYPLRAPPVVITPAALAIRPLSTNHVRSIPNGTGNNAGQGSRGRATRVGTGQQPVGSTPAIPAARAGSDGGGRDGAATNLVASLNGPSPLSHGLLARRPHALSTVPREGDVPRPPRARRRKSLRAVMDMSSTHAALSPPCIFREPCYLTAACQPRSKTPLN